MFKVVWNKCVVAFLSPLSKIQYSIFCYIQNDRNLKHHWSLEYKLQMWIFMDEKCLTKVFIIICNIYVLSQLSSHNFEKNASIIFKQRQSCMLSWMINFFLNKINQMYLKLYKWLPLKKLKEMHFQQHLYTQKWLS